MPTDDYEPGDGAFTSELTCAPPSNPLASTVMIALVPVALVAWVTFPAFIILIWRWVL